MQSFVYNGVEYKVGDAVMDSGHPERYGRITALRPHPEFDYWALATVVWKKRIQQKKEVPIHWLRPFDDLLKEHERLRKKWEALRDAALALP